MDKTVGIIGKTTDKIAEVSKSISKELDLYQYWLNDPLMLGSSHIPYDGTQYKNWGVETHIDSIFSNIKQIQLIVVVVMCTMSRIL